MNRHPLEQLAEQAGRLYTLPAVAMEVIRLADHPQVDVQALKACIENDPALTSKVLRVVNSSLFGLPRGVSNLAQALALLGTKPLKMLVLGFSLPDELFQSASDDVLQRYWQHTLTKAVAAREISERLFHSFSDEVFIAGLLEDLGLLVLVQTLGEPYVNFLRKAWASGNSLATVEQSSLGFEHRELTARLLARWELPRSLVDAIARPRDTQALAVLAAPHAMLPQALHLAELLTIYLSSHRTEDLEKWLLVADKYRGTSRFQLSQLLDALQPKIGQLADVLRIDLPASADYQAVIAEAHRQLGEVATDSAPDLVKHFRIHRSPAAPPVDPEQVLWQEAQQLSERLASLVGQAKPAAVEDEPRELDASPGTVAAAPQSLPADTIRGTAAIGQSVERLKSLDHSEIAPARDQLASLQTRLAVLALECRRRRAPLSLVLWEVDRAEELQESYGPACLARVERWLEQACREAGEPEACFVRTGSHSAGWILPGIDRGPAVSLARTILYDARQVSPHLLPREAESSDRVTCSAGVSTVTLPPKNFDSATLIEAASRCLYGAASFGGDSVKSIDVL